METDVYVRHSTECPHRNNRYYKKCRCRKWIALIGLNQRVSAQTRSWEQAERKARELSGNSVAALQTVTEAVRLFVEDKVQQNQSTNWLYKHRRELTQFADFCAQQKIRLVSQVSLQHLEDFRKTWSGASVTRSKRQERLRQFFRYAMKHKWCSENVAADLSKIKVNSAPTIPLTREQFAVALQAAANYHKRGKDSAWRQQRATAMLLLCRHSGLRISDAARLERAKLLDSDSLLLYTSKTGQGVFVPLPTHVAQLLRKLPNSNPKYFFWNGTSARESPGIRWWSTLKKIFRAAGIPNSYPHCLRDTFAVECLVNGIDIKDVSMMLGHSSVAITEKHYLPWVRARQVHLEDSMKKMWEQTEERKLEEKLAKS